MQVRSAEEGHFHLYVAVLATSSFLTLIFGLVFMNKCDLLERKLKAGIRVSRYMTSYGDRPNDFASFSSCT